MAVGTSSKFKAEEAYFMYFCACDISAEERVNPPTPIVASAASAAVDDAAANSPEDGAV